MQKFRGTSIQNTGRLATKTAQERFWPMAAPRIAITVVSVLGIVPGYVRSMPSK